MSLFQTSVLKKYLQGLDRTTVDAAFDRFATYFHNPAIQENIRNAKEEQFQEGFLRELFVNVFGYILNPNPDYNLTTEFKNLKGARKADGAILQDGKAVAVVELKGMNTTDLDKIEAQAFGYKSNQPGCQYVVTSNYEKLRFYIDNTVDFEEFHLFSLTKERFDLLWLCLSQENVFNALPKRIKEDSVVVEEDITKKLYKDYSAFKSDIFHSIVEKNKQYDKLLLFKKTQKLLDRFLFIFFAEDRLLLPPNAIRMIIDQWLQLRDELDAYTPLYERFKMYFGYMNTGHKGKLHEIFAYNGGLFEPDEILDSIKIADDLLYKHTLNLSHYDFESEVDVNILGHIFEHSLNEIEEITAELEGQAIDKGKTKRKKDGVFYTPKYITKYIVENTVGKLCEEQKTALGIVEEEYFKDRRGRKKETLKRLEKQLGDYRKWLLELTICDPACGSGAFLNQALEFLINEHRYVDELNAKLFEREGENLMVFQDVSADILEKNLYGVDINEESVEIAKLSLWLRTAQKGRKLSVLSNNIKCGNSLIDDPAVAGDKAFNWEKEFPQVFEKGGFDVVIGNPPYVRSRELFSDQEKDYFLDNFKAVSYQPDLYKLFIEKSTILIKSNGLTSFITPSVFLVNDYDRTLRKFLLTENQIVSFATSDEQIFQDASVKTVIFVLKSQTPVNSQITFYKIGNSNFEIEKQLPQDFFISESYIINDKVNKDSFEVISKMNQFPKLEQFFEVKNGIKVRKELLFSEKIDDNHKPYLLGKNIKRFYLSFNQEYIHYLPQNESLYTNQAFRSPEIFIESKLIVRQILGESIITCFDPDGYYTDQTTYVINSNSEPDLKYLLGILNSKLLSYYFKNTFSDSKITFPKVKRSQLLELPISNRKLGKTKLILLVENMIIFQKQKFEISSQFTRLLIRRFDLEKLTQKLENWHTLTYSDFIKELKKQKLKLTLSEETEWEEYFESEKTKAQAIQQQIDETDGEIDRMVYELYELTEEEISIVESSINNE
ncbi:MAG: N-6 DNA methylase [Lewinellaceae bacterium]|nr:N-6 DNA methylase [Lewinellaceae bacterium]